MNVNINLTPKKGALKKIIILGIFALLCFFLNEKVFAATSTVNLYNLVVDKELSYNDCSNAFSAYPNFLSKFGLNDYSSLNSNQCSAVIKSIKPYQYIESAINSGYKYYLIVYYYFTNDYYSGDFTESPTIYFFKNIPQGKSTNLTYNMYPDYPNYLTSTSNLEFVNFTGNSLFINTQIDSDYFFPGYNFNVIEATQSTIDTNTNLSVNDYSYTSYVSNFNFYTTDGELISSATDIIFEIPEDNLAWYEKILNSILNLPNNIKNFFTTLGKDIGNFFNDLLEGIKSLFIPDFSLLEDSFKDQYDYINKKLGFLTYPISVVADFANRFYALSDSNSAVFKIPELKVFNYTLYEGTSFDLMTLVNGNENIKRVYNIYKIAVSGFIVLWLVQLAVKKEQEIFGGGTSVN